MLKRGFRYWCEQKNFLDAVRVAMQENKVEKIWTELLPDGSVQIEITPWRGIGAPPVIPDIERQWWRECDLTDGVRVGNYSQWLAFLWLEGFRGEELGAKIASLREPEYDEPLVRINIEQPRLFDETETYETEDGYRGTPGELLEEFYKGPSDLVFELGSDPLAVAAILIATGKWWYHGQRAIKYYL